MVEFNQKVDGRNRIYIPKLMRESGFDKTIKIIPNATAAIMFGEDTNLKDVLKSIDIIKADLQHRANLKEKEEEPQKPTQDSSSSTRPRRGSHGQ